MYVKLRFSVTLYTYRTKHRAVVYGVIQIWLNRIMSICLKYHVKTTSLVIWCSCMWVYLPFWCPDFPLHTEVWPQSLSVCWLPLVCL